MKDDAKEELDSTKDHTDWGRNSNSRNHGSKKKKITKDTKKDPFLTVEASDMIRLILGYLTSQGLHESARVLRNESGIGFPSHVALVPSGSTSSSSWREEEEDQNQEGGGIPSSSIVPNHIQQGEWGSVLSMLQLYQNPYPSVLVEHIILELASTDDPTGLAMAQHLLAVSRSELDQLPEDDDADDDNDLAHGDDQQQQQRRRLHQHSMTSITLPGEEDLSVARRLEQRLAALAANPRKYESSPMAKHEVLFGRRSSASSSYQEYKQHRRNQLATQFQKTMIHTVPLNRLSVLIHQALKWQTWTGQFPMLKTTTIISNHDNSSDAMKKRKKRKHYSLLLGRAPSDNGAVVGDDDDDDDDEDERDSDSMTLAAMMMNRESIPSEKIATIKFGKSVVCEAVVIIRNAIITASSDGFIELWELGGSYSLNTIDYPYQAKDQVMGHDPDIPVLTLSVSRDQTMLASGDSMGIVKIWKLENGTCLRHFQAHPNSITAMDWSPDGTKLLVASSEGRCREFGIVSQHVLQEYIGHSSMIHSCFYLQDWNHDTEEGFIRIVTSSNDGTVRLWDPHGHCQAIWQPPTTTTNSSSASTKDQDRKRRYHHNIIGTSIVVDSTSILTDSPSIVACCPVPSTPSHILIVPRSSTAVLIDGREGTVLQKYSIPTATATSTAANKGSTSSDNHYQHQEDDNGIVFCSATVTAHWVYLCTTGNECLVFPLLRGHHSGHSSNEFIHTIPTFGIDSTTPLVSTTTTSSSSAWNRIAEISQIIPHPHKAGLIAFSNDKTQKKGIVAVWK